MTKLQTILAILIFSVSAAACTKSEAKSQNYTWQNVTAKADYPTGYNYPVYIVDGKMLALNNGGWFSSDGKNWTKSPLPKSGLNSAFQKFVQFKGAIYALGTMEGNIEKMTLSTQISRTRDGKSWEIVAEKSNLPKRVFYGATVFQDKIWIFGGMFENQEFDDVWNSADGVHWQKVSEKMPWGKRENLKAVVFKNKIFLLGDKGVWSSADGLNWQIETSKMANNPIFISGYSAAVWDDKIWLVGINRNGTFQSGVLYSADGKNWHEMNAPWTPRGAVAVWVFNDKLYMTGGKYSFVERGETKFVYSNDVWAMSKVVK